MNTSTYIEEAASYHQLTFHIVISAQHCKRQLIGMASTKFTPNSSFNISQNAPPPPSDAYCSTGSLSQNKPRMQRYRQTGKCRCQLSVIGSKCRTNLLFSTCTQILFQKETNN